MSDTLTQPDLQIELPSTRPDSAVDPQAYEEYRTSVLKNLFGTDYDHIQQSGILDLFEYNPSEHRDALLHVLIGDTPIETDGLPTLPGGFHHEPSAQDRYTYVDREHLVSAGSNKRKAYEERPYEPYRARVVINGLRRLKIISDPDTNEQKAVPIIDNMFPKEYDAVTVLKTIEYAYEHQLEETKKENNDKIIVESIVPLANDEKKLRVRLVLDAQTGKICTAHPLASKARLISEMTPKERKEMLGL